MRTLSRVGTPTSAAGDASGATSLPVRRRSAPLSPGVAAMRTFARVGTPTSAAGDASGATSLPVRRRSATLSPESRASGDASSRLQRLDQGLPRSPSGGDSSPLRRWPRSPSGGSPSAHWATQASSKRWLPKVSSTGAIQPELPGRRKSDTDLKAVASRVLTLKTTSPSNVGRRQSLGSFPAGSGLQAARMDGKTPQPLQRQSLDSWQAHAPRLEQPPRPDPGTDARDWPAQAIAGFVGTPLTRGSRLAKAALATLAEPRPKTHSQEHLGFSLDDAQSPATSPHACASEGTRATSTSPRAIASEDTLTPSWHASVNEVAQAPENPEAQSQVPLAPTLREIYESYTHDEIGLSDRFMRLTFKRFALDGAVPKERLHDALLHLGFLTSTRERSLDVSAELYEFDIFDYSDFCEYVGKFAAIQHTAVRQAADACAAELSIVAAAPDSVRRFLHSAGVRIPYSAVEEARNAARLEDKRPEDMSANDLLLTLAACRMREGFTNEGVVRAQKIFGGMGQMPQVSPIGWGPLAKVSELSKGMLKYLGVYSLDYINSLADVLPSNSAEQQGVCFYEFLVWARRLHDTMVQDLWERFQEFEDGVSGTVPLDVADNILRTFGISLLQDATDDLLSDLGMQKDTALDFHALVQFIRAARRTHGFSRAEFEELRSAYQKFDYNRSGELNHIEVLALLRYNGYTTNIEQANVMMRRVDFDKSGTMDLDEFSMLMRLMREELIGYARKTFDELSSSTGQLPQGKVTEALAKVHIVPRRAMLEELLQGMPAEVSFSEFMYLHDQCRHHVNLEFRKYVGFSDSALEKIARLWRCGGSTKREFATVGELIWMFVDSRAAPVSTKDGRDELLRRVEAARADALAAGAPQEEVTRAGTTDIGFCTFVHLIRGMVHKLEQDVLDREHQAMSVSHIPYDEESEFRSAFRDLSARDTVWDRPLAKADLLLAQLTMVPAIPESSMPTLLKSIGLRVPSNKLDDLKVFLAKTRSQGEAEQRSIQFATFLRMLGWMFDTDFAGICAVMAFPKKAAGA